MLPELRTSRLTLRLARPGMEDAVARFLSENFAGHLDRWSPPVPEGYFDAGFWRERLQASVDEYHADRAVRFLMQLRPAAADAPAGLAAPVIGTCNYTNIVRGAFHACHLGYQISASHEGKGLMAEALGAANAFMFGAMRMHRLMANYRTENTRSRALLERLGFAIEGLARSYLFIDGAWRDHVLTSLVNPAYDDSWVVAPRGLGSISRAR